MKDPAGPSSHNVNTRLLISRDTSARLGTAAEWLNQFPADAELTLVAATLSASDELARTAAGERGARFGLHRFALGQLAARSANLALANAGRTTSSFLTLVALVARSVHLLIESRPFTYFQPVARTPGFPVAAARTIEELRMNGLTAQEISAVNPAGPDLAALLDKVEAELASAGIADRALVFQEAIAAVENNPEFPLAARPLVLIDLPVNSVLETRFVAALARRASEVLAVAPFADRISIENLERALGCKAEDIDTTSEDNESTSTSLQKLKSYLFQNESPRSSLLDDTVRITSAPGEARECVEIARQIQTEAAAGIPFDRMAIFLRSNEQYRPHLQEAFYRARIPVYFARGTTRPDPAGRALLALLACKSENLSAKRFAEYLSLSQVPDRTEESAGGSEWVPPQHDLMPIPVTTETSIEDESGDTEEKQARAGSSAATDTSDSNGSAHAPWRWERLLVEAAVIGSRERWENRLLGLKNQIERQRTELDDPDGAQAAALTRQLGDIEKLREFALPLIDKLVALPDQANWGEWLTALRDLTDAAIRDKDRILEALAELEPTSPIGPIDIDELLLVLRPRLRELPVPAVSRRYGRVFIGPVEAARGLSFDLVFIPGLAEKLFPKKIVEDPILLDEARRTLAEGRLLQQDDRLESERLLLRLAIGSATKRVYLSYPRIDIEQSRARVPSLYTLEVFRASEGTLPDLDRLESIARSGPRVRLGWPAPEHPEDAIDEAEYDLALLSPMITSGEGVPGTAHYLLSANPHLARALRRRARRWLRRWTSEDGLVDIDDLARAALAGHQISERSYSATGLQNYSNCPYKFFLQAVLRLQPHEEPAAIETIDPLTRGSIFHDSQFEILSNLKRNGMLPLKPEGLDEALAMADEIAVRVSVEYRDNLYPAIPRVWDDGINRIRTDLREWLRRSVTSADGWIPHRFELAFGLKDRDRPHQDPESVDYPIEIVGGLKLRGSIDLVERRRDGLIRVTDHKTGKVYAKADVIVGGGQVLQPVLYALAAEKMLNSTVESGRLYYCTSDGGYSERTVALNEEARAAAAKVVDVISKALTDGFLPAAPEKGCCLRCDYRLACGPSEETRARIQEGRKSGNKPADRVKELLELRKIP